jgi:prephenate dehydrogenase
LRASIIGGRGKMGRWLHKYLVDRGFFVEDVDLRKKNIIETGINSLRSSDLVIVSVPISENPAVLKQVAQFMNEGAVITEIASLKSNAVAALKETVDLGLHPLSIHPMFGPSTKSLCGKTVAVVPLSNSSWEMDYTRKLFPEADVTCVEAEEHDRVMSLVLSLVYLVNLAFASTLKGNDLHLLKQLSGSSFSVQYALAQSIVGEDSCLIENLIGQSQFLIDQTKLFEEKFSEVLSMFNQPGAFKSYHAELVQFMKMDPDFPDANQVRTDVFRSLTTSNN